MRISEPDVLHIVDNNIIWNILSSTEMHMYIATHCKQCALLMSIVQIILLLYILQVIFIYYTLTAVLY
jgi:hypothetical protein